MGLMKGDTIKRNYLYTVNPNFYKIRYKALDSPCTAYT